MSLELHQDERFSRRESRAERIGWVLLGVVVLAGLAGALGPGPLSAVTATGSAGVVRAEYDRFAHIEADDAVTLRFTADAVQDGAVTVRFAGDWLEHIDLSGMTPQPAEETAVPGGLDLEFPAEDGSELTVHITFRADSIGRLTSTVEAAGDSVTIDQLVLP